MHMHWTRSGDWVNLAAILALENKYVVMKKETRAHIVIAYACTTTTRSRSRI